MSRHYLELQFDTQKKLDLSLMLGLNKNRV